MSFTSLLRHTVEVRRRVAVLDAGLPTYDERGQPITALASKGTVRCRIEPLSAREVALLSQAGPVVGDHRLFMVAGTDVLESDQLVDGDRLFEVHRIDDLGGAGRYLELQAQLVTSRDVPTT
jgi:head-tail adaptor